MNLETTYLDVRSWLPHRNPVHIIYRRSGRPSSYLGIKSFLFDLVINFDEVVPSSRQLVYITSYPTSDAMPKKRYDDEALRRKALELRRLGMSHRLR